MDRTSVLLIQIVVLCLTLLTYTGIRKSTYRTILENEDRLVMDKSRKLENIMGTYWMIILAVYIGYSLISKNWGKSWIIWPV